MLCCAPRTRRAIEDVQGEDIEYFTVAAERPEPSEVPGAGPNGTMYDERYKGVYTKPQRFNFVSYKPNPKVDRIMEQTNQNAMRFTHPHPHASRIEIGENTRPTDKRTQLMARLSGGLSSSADMAITNDRGRLSEEDIKRMIADGNSNRWRDEAKNDLADAGAYKVLDEMGMLSPLNGMTQSMPLTKAPRPDLGLHYGFGAPPPRPNERWGAPVANYFSEKRPTQHTVMGGDHNMRFDTPAFANPTKYPHEAVSHMPAMPGHLR